MKIVLPGIPVSQARMKHSRRGNFINTYDPKAKEKADIRQKLKAYVTHEPFNFPRISFLFYMPIPSATPKKKLPLFQSGKLKHDKKPDVDNLIKLYVDCLDGIIIEGDQKVSLGPCLKLYSSCPCTIIWIQETTEILNPLELDIAFYDVSRFDELSFSEQDCPSYS